MFVFPFYNRKKEGNWDYASEMQHYQVSDSKHLCSGNSDADIKYVTPFLVLDFVGGRGRGSFSFKICKVRVVWELILPLASLVIKTSANKSELVSFAMSFYMYTVFETVQWLSFFSTSSALSICIHRGHLKFIIWSHL